MVGSDSGVYKCSASNILGQAESMVQLVVNGKLFILLDESLFHFLLSELLASENVTCFDSQFK